MHHRIRFEAIFRRSRRSQTRREAGSDNSHARAPRTRNRSGAPAVGPSQHLTASFPTIFLTSLAARVGPISLTMRRDAPRWHRTSSAVNRSLFLIRFCALAPYCKPLQILNTVHTVLQYSQTLIKCWKIRGILVFFGGRRQRLLISGL